MRCSYYYWLGMEVQSGNVGAGQFCMFLSVSDRGFQIPKLSADCSATGLLVAGWVVFVVRRDRAGRPVQADAPGYGPDPAHQTPAT